MMKLIQFMDQLELSLVVNLLPEIALSIIAQLVSETYKK